MQPVSLDSLITDALPWAKKIVADKIGPIIYTKIKKSIRNFRDRRFIDENMESFLSRVKGQCSLINTLAFQNTPVELLKIYEPLSISIDNENDPYECIIHNNCDIINSFNHVLITDSAGMGKSTILKRIALFCIDNDKHIPIYIELRSIRNSSISNQIKNRLGLSSDFPDDTLKELPFIYLFDGIDEIPQNIKSETIQFLKEFSENFKNKKIIVTSRHDGFLSELYTFSRFKIIPLESYQSYNLLRKYDNSRTISATLIKGLQREEGKILDEFLSTPLYVSLLYCAYKFKPIIPRKKELFYSQVYEALYESHDLTKELGYVREKHSKLDSTDFHYILRRLGFWCLKNDGRVEFTKVDLSIIIKDITSNISGINVDTPMFIKDLIETVPLFVKEGAILRWSHKSLMEYFAAMFICRDTKNKQADILKKLYHSNNSINYTNLFELCADIDYTTFRASIVKEIFCEFVEETESRISTIELKGCNRNEHNAKFVETIFTGDVIVYIFDKRFESQKLTNLIEGDISLFKELQKENAYIKNMFLELSNLWVVIARSVNIKTHILNIVKYRNPGYFRNSLTHTSDDPKIRRSMRKITQDKPEVTLYMSKRYSTPCRSVCTLELINSIIEFDTSPRLKYESAMIELKEIKLDESNGINMLIDGF
ncbi:NACHT domain-containing protein [Rahnella sp. PAMC 25559]|uniref:NACHT domain-containing protein n=1 Tax=Rahnella sp. PAMC 25559 TaxID=3423225 RepID=UPI003D673DDB